MKYKVKKVADFENNIEIDIDFEDLESKKDEAINKISKSLKVKGFRPGKIPKNIVEREVGEDYIFCLLYTSPSPRDVSSSRMPSSA